MKNLLDAEILVETVFSIESSQNNGTWFCLSDYDGMDEFLTDCASWFGEEKPEYLYKEWRGIPHRLISERWIAPNFFELRDALQALEESMIDVFWKWCASYGWNPATDDPYKLVADFENAMGGTASCDDDCPDSDDEESYILLCDPTGNSFEVFDDNYN